MEATSKILNYIGQDPKQNWYVGIATDPRSRLFHDHNVNETQGHWIYVPVESEQSARAIERYLLTTFPFRGGTGGGTNPRYVYAYRMTWTTVQ